MALAMVAPTLIPNATPIGSSSTYPFKHGNLYHSTTVAFSTQERPSAVNCRPAVILPGLGNNSSDYQKLQLILKDYGIPTVVANVSRIDWLRNAAGLVDPNYWMALAMVAPTLIPNATPIGSSSTYPFKHGNLYHSTTVAFSTQERPSAVNCRPAVILPGLGNNSSDYQKLQLILKDYGIPTVVANVSRIDWLRNAAGLVDPNYWRGTLSPRPVLDWYLKRVNEAVCEAKLNAEGERLSVIGHSAGGWLARLYMEEYGISHISLLLTLGTPHMPAPKGVPGVIDQTRGLLDYVDKNCAKAVYTPELKYVCIAGRYIQGARFFGNSSSTDSIESDQPLSEAVLSDKPLETAQAMNSTSTSMPVTSTARARFIGQGYKQVCGKTDVWGDGVVPEVSAHLEGALNLSFDGVYHSPVGSDDSLRPWYGSPAVVEKWVHHLLS